MVFNQVAVACKSCGYQCLELTLGLTPEGNARLGATCPHCKGQSSTDTTIEILVQSSKEYSVSRIYTAETDLGALDISGPVH